MYFMYIMAGGGPWSIHGSHIIAWSGCYPPNTVWFAQPSRK